MEYVNIALTLFVKRYDVFKKFAEEIRKRESKITIKKYKFASDLLKLTNILEYITLIYFFHIFHVQFFDKHFVVLKGVNYVFKQPEMMVRHMAIHSYSIYNDICYLRDSY